MAIAKVLLTKTVDALGHAGEIVDVSEGYARNYLFPRRLAVEPTPDNVARHTKARAVHETEVEEKRGRALRLRERLADQTLVFLRKAHDDDRLYGSVRAEDIAAWIKAETGEELDPERIELHRPIETAGAHSVLVHLHKDVAVELRVRVDKEGKEA